MSTLQRIIDLITIQLTLTPTSFLKETCLQLRRYLRSLDGSTNTGGSPKCFTLPHVLWSCHMTKHKKMAQVGTWQQISILGGWNGRRRYNIAMTCGFGSSIDWCIEFVRTTSVRYGYCHQYCFMYCHFTKETKGNLVCHDRFMKFKMNRYHSKSDEIHVGLGVT